MVSPQNPEEEGMRLNNRWRILLILILILTVLLVIFFTQFVGEKFGTVSVDTLSERSQEFIASEQQKGGSEWRNRWVAISATPAVEKTASATTDCFRVIAPFPIRSIEKNDTKSCVTTFRISSPYSRVTISLSTLSTKLTEHSAVLMRESNTKSYTPIAYISQLFPIYKIYSDPQGVSFFADTNGELLSVVFSETSSQETIVQQSLPSILEAIQIIPKTERQLAATAANSLQ